MSLGTMNRVTRCLTGRCRDFRRCADCLRRVFRPERTLGGGVLHEAARRDEYMRDLEDRALTSRRSKAIGQCENCGQDVYYSVDDVADLHVETGSYWCEPGDPPWTTANHSLHARRP